MVSNAELQELFLAAQCPYTEEFNGIYKVRVLTGFWLSTNYKVIHHREGSNLLFGCKEWGRFRVKYGTTQGLELAVLFDYELKSNWGATRRIRDYVRRIDPGLYLGAFNYVWKREYRFVGYFLLMECEEGGVECNIPIPNW